MSNDVRKIEDFFGQPIRANNFYHVWAALQDDSIRTITLRGGSSSSKTWSVLECLVLLCLKGKEHITVVGKTVGSLQDGAYKDFQSIISNEHIAPMIANIHQTRRKITFTNGSVIIFKVFDEHTARGPRNTYSYFVEVNTQENNEVYNQVAMRTANKIIACYNPSHKFWYQDQIEKQSDNINIYSNWRDNPFVSKEIIKHLQSLEETDENAYKTYCLGLQGSITGLVFPKFNKVFTMPEEELDWQSLGLDWGYSNDEAAVVLVRFYKGQYYVQQLIHEKKLTNKDLSELIFEQIEKHDLPENIEIIADSSEPKSVAELKGYGHNIKPVIKGNGSLNFGISILNTYPINVHKDSLDLIAELLAYRYTDSKAGVKGADHLLDATRYAAMANTSEKQRPKKRTKWIVPFAKQQIQKIQNKNNFPQFGR